MVVIAGLLALAILTLINAAPVAWLAMLTLGNLGHSFGFLDILPGAAAVHLLKNSVFTYNKDRKV